MRSSLFLPIFFFFCVCVCGVWKTKYPKVIDFPIGDAHLSMSTPTALGFKCSIS